MSLLSRRIQSIPASQTLALVGRAARLRAEGKKVISFAAGELDFDTPPSIVDDTVRALRSGPARYAPAPGLPAFRRAAAGYLSRRHGIALAEKNVAITVGAKQAIFNALVSVIDPGDLVLVPSPYWVSYPAMVSLAGGEPVILETAAGREFKATGAEIASIAAGKKIRAVLLNSPSNPTGSLYDEAELRDIYEACGKEGIFIISDEIYSNIVFDGRRHVSLFDLAGGVSDAFCVAGGMSKSFAMTGWRIGWLAGSPELVGAVARTTAQTTSCAVSFIQEGCIAALDGDLDPCGEWTPRLQERRDVLLPLVEAVEGVTCLRPRGAFYLWVDVRGLLGRRTPGGKIIESSAQLSEHLIEDAALVVVPGSAFGCEGFMRFSFAVSMEEMKEGARRFRKSVSALS